MAGIAAQQPGAADLAMGPSEGMGTEMYARRTNIRAPPENPNFSFPRLSRNPPSSEDTSDAPRKPRIRPTNLAILPHQPLERPPLTPEPAESSVNTSPSRSRPMSARSGHRRGGSEFIGGDGKGSGPGLMSTSPTKGVTTVDHPMPSAPSAPSAAGRRRGHAHRRSGAMSTNDFSAFLNSSASSAPPLPGSAPATPSGHAHNVPPVPHLERHHSQPQMSTREKIDEANAAGEKEDREMAATPANNGARPRVVGFSDKVVIIPRPLSTISQADTESTISTIRPAHSVNGSVSSVFDQRPPTPVSTTHPVDSSDDSRPTTSDNASQTEFFGPAEGVADSPERPNSGSGLGFMKRYRSPPPLLDENISPGTVVDPDFHASMASDLQASFDSAAGLDASDQGSPSSENKSEKRKSRMRSILSRKSRKHSKEDSVNSSPTIASAPIEPVLGPNVPDGLVSLDDVNFDEDTTCVIHSAGYEEPQPAPYLPSPSPGKETFDKDDSAVLDLDATYYSATHDENSPSSLANFMKGGLSMRQHRRTESAPSLSPVQRSGFAPGKASPRMDDVFEEDEEDDAPVRAQRPKARSFHQPKSRELKGLGVQIVDAEAADTSQPRRKSRSPSSKSTSSTKASSVEDVPVSISQIPPVPSLPLNTAKFDFDLSSSSLTKSSDDDTITPTDLHDSARRIINPALNPPLIDPIMTVPSPLDFVPPPPLGPHSHHDSSDFSISSTAPSPHPTTASFDVPRLNTAASSLTDRTNWSTLQTTAVTTAKTYRDDVPAAEDVPSLTSSASASTAPSGHPSHPSTSTTASAAASPVIPRGPAFFSNSPGYHAHTVSGSSRPRTNGFVGENINRPSSVGAERAFSLAGLGGLSPRTSMPRPWSSRPSTANASKRGSLASLSKLMGKGSEGERSKLSNSWGVHDDNGEGMVLSAKEGKDKGGKRRLSRMLKFWKGKDKDKAGNGRPVLEQDDNVQQPDCQ